ncbi:putative C6 transcription factor [Aspergillus ibericus CBS 121593]|uniref:Putative C6 transcription factor n=1 Tax=Aspergillus ibericus CBS 121593 TaxID=1448316 RepID=A0A395GQ07_9EURO|nr:putative C6 transcription factor [Aspergillus ibericus CBS 121593]RAK97559.1 putative C6 transcription factor [Aspergillus ibericus CBS 121593]
MDSPSSVLAEPPRRRRRPAVSCSLCRSRKIRCNRQLPCSNCVRTRNENCVYANQASPIQRKRLSQVTEVSTLQPQQALRIDRDPSSNGPPCQSQQSDFLINSPVIVSPVSTQQPTEVEALKSRIKHLEEQLAKAQKPTLSRFRSNIETSTACITKRLHVQYESASGRPAAITRGIMNKTRLLGQSYWISGLATLLRDLFQTVEPYLLQETSKMFSGFYRCKALARTIKARRAPKWPTPPSVDLPPKDLADKLVECYFQTTETIYPVIHVPSFRTEYDAVWASDSEPRMAFVVQLKLMLAIGATTYDQQFSLRPLAYQWVYEAQTWLAEPDFKSRLTIQSLQIHILLLIAREATGIGPTLVWISTGELLRTAVNMGLHRDPKHLPHATLLTAEMRRRLWNTILEVCLQSSLTSGGPPMITLDDFDADPPGNFNDEQLMTANPEPSPDTTFTRISIAIALRKTLPLRLTIIKFLNDLSSHGTYDETLRLDTQLRTSYKELYQTLQIYTSCTSPPPFAIRAVDVLIQRYLSSLHLPYFALSLHDAPYAFSRKVVVETALKIWRSTYQSSSSSPTSEAFTRFVTSGAGLFRTTTVQASTVIATELRFQLQEDHQSLDPVPLRPDLVRVLEESKTWTLQCMESGETNTKGYLLTHALVAQVQGLMRGVTEQEMHDILVKTADEGVQTCLRILEGKASEGQADYTDDAGCLTPSNFTPDLQEDFDFDLLMPGAILNSGDAELMNWMFCDNAVQETYGL